MVRLGNKGNAGAIVKGLEEAMLSGLRKGWVSPAYFLADRKKKKSTMSIVVKKEKEGGREGGKGREREKEG
jgi:hypothetical protein